MEKKITPILMYHSIKTPPKSEVMKSLHVSPKAFDLQMKILKTLGYTGCSITNAAALREQGEKPVVLTFDDGYKNFFETALPTLKKYQFTATVYCVSGLLDTFNSWDQNTGISRNELMGPKMIRKALESNIEIGCHSATHCSLIDDKTDLDAEIVQSKAALENIIEQPVTSFCYPYGHVNKSVRAQVRACNFATAVTMIRSRSTDEDDKFMLPRIPVTWHTLPHLFVLKIVSRYEDRRRFR